MPNEQSTRADGDELKVVIVCPMANEAATAGTFVEAVLDASAVFDDVRMLCIIDNASTDNTLLVVEEIASRDDRVSVVWAPKNRCIADAYASGYRAALATGWPWILEIDAGFSHDPVDIMDFAPLMRQNYDCIFGTRFCLGGSYSESPLLRKIVSSWGSLLTRLVMKTSLSDMTSGFQAFRQLALQAIVDDGIVCSGRFFHAEMKISAQSMRFQEVPIRFRFASRGLRATELWEALSVLWAIYRRQPSNAKSQYDHKTCALGDFDQRAQ